MRLTDIVGYIDPEFVYNTHTGEVMSNEKIKWLMDKAVQQEKYEYAAKCQRELKRRINQK